MFRYVKGEKIESSINWEAGKYHGHCRARAATVKFSEFPGFQIHMSPCGLAHEFENPGNHQASCK